MRFLYNKCITNWASSASISKWSKWDTKVIKDWMTTKDYNGFLNCCLPGKKTNEVREVTHVSGELKKQNQWGLPCLHTSVHCTVPAPVRSWKPQSSWSHLIPILPEGHKRLIPCILLSLCPQEHQAHTSVFWRNMQPATCLHGQHSQ